jgi:hypothetical protein
MAEAPLSLLYNKVENELRKPLNERNQELLDYWNAEIASLKPALVNPSTGKFLSLFALKIIRIFHSLYLS